MQNIIDPATSSPDPLRTHRVTPGEALARLRAGNARFAAGTPAPVALVQRRAAVATSQAPVATVLTCSDSRVVPELIFDQSLGDLFVIRVAGNFVDDGGLGSMEFAVESLQASLIVVLGHEECAAVAAVRQALETGQPLAPHRDAFERGIAPALRETIARGASLDDCVVANAAYQAAAVAARSERLAGAVRAKRLEIVAATYRLGSGRVTFLDG